jgi:uncharacterized protein YjiS (DUF1127 family)
MNIRAEKYTADIDAASALDALLQKVRAWAKREALKQQLSKERRQLAEMSDEMLADLGIDRSAALVEASKTDIPAVRMTFTS